MARRTGGRGFLAGFLTGLAIAVLAALALAFIYPPVPPAAVDDAAPGAQPGPAGADAGPEPMLTPAPGPVLDGVPAPGEPAEEGAGQDGPGSPSLVPPGDG